MCPKRTFPGCPLASLTQTHGAISFAANFFSPLQSIDEDIEQNKPKRTLQPRAKRTKKPNEQRGHVLTYMTPQVGGTVSGCLPTGNAVSVDDADRIHPKNASESHGRSLPRSLWRLSCRSVCARIMLDSAPANNCAGSLGHCRGWKIWSKQAWALLLRCYHHTHGSVPWATSWNRSNPNQNKCMKSRRRQSANITTNRAAHDAKSTSATPGCGKNPIQARGQVRFNQHQGSATSRFLVAAQASLAICLATVVCMLVLLVACAPQVLVVV